MRRQEIVCDICGRPCKSADVYQIPVRSGRFVSYANFDEFFADRKRIDVCSSCVKDFKCFVKAHRKDAQDVETKLSSIDKELAKLWGSNWPGL